ncbi:putative outer membrane protein [Flavobacterium limnosediminis JC2902]|uniref:Putative outer membrane protein n=1 Tax=Flavobacterium limnosediminis JC2902 TaxID=1341181 RepID=V6SPY7_9FLAO|nr:RagB/SusD family nutrient uptake outer membrane protein [Flavobacterium limnosediminis]ESU28743.1 putative outer membrane protein [Flavobacterium limnosediminis JC2902]
MKNNKYIRIIAIAFLALGFYGCDSFTEVGLPETQLTGPAVFEEASTANAALANIYARMREGGMVSGTAYGLSSLMGNYSDELIFYSNNMELQQFNLHTLTPSNGLLSTLWNTTYSHIYETNALIEGINASSALTETDRNRLRGEALFIRGYLHFYLTNLFGSVPYITTTDYHLNSKAVKVPEAQVYQAIINDLTESESLVSEEYPTTERVNPNKAVVKALLARIHLYLQNWSQAEAYATEVINNPLYNWEPNVANVFLKSNPGIIMALHPGIAGANTKDARTFIFSFGPPSKPALSPDLVNNFETGDLRKTNWVKTVPGVSNTWFCSFKYKKTLNTGTSQEYTILFRLAEQYLIRAEARAHLGNIEGSQQDLNKIRTRAGLPDTPANDSSSLITAILKERRMELFTEMGHRWFDLKRTGTAADVLSPIKPGWEDTQVVLPLPESELMLNNNLLPQNPGY